MIRLLNAIQELRSCHFLGLATGIDHAGLRKALGVFVLVVSIGSAFGIAILASRMAPVRSGSPIEFWKCATGVALDHHVDEFGGTPYCVDDNWVAYDVPHLHGSDAYYVSNKEIAPYFETVVRSLQRSHENGEDSFGVRGYENWCKIHFQQRNTKTLIQCVRESLREVTMQRGAESLASQNLDEQIFWKRWQQSKCYWANVIFEWLFLSGLAAFIAWPVLRCRSPFRWAAHVTVSPLLFLMPTYLGYATWSFTTAGPSGGILYPFLLLSFRGGTGNKFDEWLLGRLPQILEPLSAPIGMPVSLTFWGVPGPTFALSVGLYLGGGILGASAGLRHRMNSSASNQDAIR